jgi:hypothetical protein
LFREHRNLIQTTSLLRFPTFVSDKVYAGAPDMIRNAFLKGFLYEHFVEEVRLLPDALFFGLGPKVQSVLARLADEGAIRPEQVITGLLHPSGNNTYRIDYLIGDRRGPLPHATDPKAYDAGRELFREQLRQ